VWVSVPRYADESWCRGFWLALAVVVATLLGTGSTSAEPSPFDPGQLQERVGAAGFALSDHPRRPGKVSPAKRRALAEFVAGNMLFILLHEAAHAIISDRDLAVLGREEDAADMFAAVTMLKLGKSFSDSVLVGATKGLFYSDFRDRKLGASLAYYEEHGLDRQRAYQIVCLMVGADPRRFREVADAAMLPSHRRDDCRTDFRDASRSWERMLGPHQRRAEEPKASIVVTYGVGKGNLEVAARFFRAIQVAEAVGNHLAEGFVWSAPLSIEVQSCGAPDAHWDGQERKIVLCYEMATYFAHLYRDYADKARLVARMPSRPE
jgi:hypothetical protein